MAESSTRSSGSSRLRQTGWDMARSLGLMAVVIAALLFLGPARALVFPGSDIRPAVDDSGAIRGFGTATGLPVIAPSGLPASWRVNAASLTRLRGASVLHVGWALPHAGFAELDETDGAAAPLLRSVLGRPGAAVLGTEQVGAATWERRRSARGEPALSRSYGSTYVVLTGAAGDAQLRQLAASLG